MNPAVALADPWRPYRDYCKGNVERIDVRECAFSKLNKEHEDLGIPLQSLMKPTSEEGAEGAFEPAPATPRSLVKWRSNHTTNFERVGK